MRKVLFALLAAAFMLVPLAGARSANEPQATSAPSIHQDGTQLVLDNGGWFSYSGPVDLYVFRFSRDGQLVKGAASVPKSEPWGSGPLAGQYPNDPAANIYPLSVSDYGHQFCGDVYGGTHSKYVRADGSVAYDVIEWGHTLAQTGAPLQWACLVAQGSSPPAPVSPNPAAAAADINAAMGEWAGSAWARANPREWTHLKAYFAGGPRPMVATPVGRGVLLAIDAYHYARGEAAQR